MVTKGVNLCYGDGVNAVLHIQNTLVHIAKLRGNCRGKENPSDLWAATLC